MKTLKWALAVMSLSLVAACGGGKNAGISPFEVDPVCNAASAASSPSPSCSSAAKTVDVLASTVQVGSGGDTVTITAVVKDSNNVALGNAPVTFSTNTGNITAASAVTNATGVATATFSAGADRANRQATVSVKSGSANGSIVLDIVGTVVSYSGVTTVSLNSTATLPIKAVDSRGTPISGFPITVTSSLGNGLSSSSLTTDSLGTAAVVYTATNSGADTLTFSAPGSSVAPVIQISAADFTFVTPAPNTQIPVSTLQTVTVRYLSNNVPQAGKTVQFAATAGVVNPPSAVTDASGQASTTVSSASASPAVIQATVPGDSVQTTLPVAFVALTPVRLVLQASPTAIGPNPAGSSSQQSQLVATVTDTIGNPVSGATVTFTRLADPSSGNLSQASTATGANGQATVQYIAGPLTTAADGVVVRAAVLGSPSIFHDVALTVNQSALFISLSTGNTISNLDEQTYKKDYVAYVTDSNGVAVPNINLTLSLLPVGYMKGSLVFAGSSWGYGSNVSVCANEDLDADGVLDPGEDVNNSGRIEPGNVAALMSSSARTGSDGRTTISFIYGEEYAPWLTVRLTARAIVAGTESSVSQTFLLSGAASDFNSQSVPPAGQTSPFGVNDCATPN